MPPKRPPKNLQMKYIEIIIEINLGELTLRKLTCVLLKVNVCSHLVPGWSSPGACLRLLPLLQVQPWPVGKKNRSSPSRSCPPAPAPPGDVLPPKLACLFLLPQELKPWLCWAPLRAPWMVGPSTAAPKAPRPRPTMPPSKAWLPVKEGVSPPRKNFSSTSPEVGLFVFLLAELPLLLEEEDTPPLN